MFVCFIYLRRWVVRRAYLHTVSQHVIYFHMNDGTCRLHLYHHSKNLLFLCIKSYSQISAQIPTTLSFEDQRACKCQEATLKKSIYQMFCFLVCVPIIWDHSWDSWKTSIHPSRNSCFQSIKTAERIRLHPVLWNGIYCSLFPILKHPR